MCRCDTSQVLQYNEADTLPLSPAVPSRELVKPPVCVLTGAEREARLWLAEHQIFLLPIKATFILTEKLSSLASQVLSKNQGGKCDELPPSGLSMWLPSNAPPPGGYLPHNGVQIMSHVSALFMSPVTR